MLDRGICVGLMACSRDPVSWNPSGLAVSSLDAACIPLANGPGLSA